MTDIPPIQSTQPSEGAQNANRYTNHNIASNAVALLTIQSGLNSILAALHKGSGWGGTARVSTT